MVSIHKCINAAGPASRVQLPAVPELEQEISLGAAARAAIDCWGYRAGEIITVTDPQLSEYRARITTVELTSISVIPFQSVGRSESLLRITVLQALPEKERFELILQKATELGVARIVPYISQRSISLTERNAGQKKSHRWPEVLLRAARQCRRAEIPELSPVVDWDSALAECSQAELSLICYEGEGGWPLKDALKSFHGQRVALLVGPEGGFSKEEVEQAKSRGILPVSLGPRILRTETAAIVGAGIIQYAAGDLGD